MGLSSAPPSPNVANGMGPLDTGAEAGTRHTPRPHPYPFPDRTRSRPSRAQNPADPPRPRPGFTWAVQPHLRPAALGSRSGGVCPPLPARPHLRAHEK